jgi:putative ABC transport system permease protein
VVSTVIGVVGDTHQLSIEEGTRPEISKPMIDYTQLTLAVRGDENPDELIGRVKNQIWAVDRLLPLYEVQTMEHVIDQTNSQRQFESFVMSIFAFLALVLSSLGLYGVLSALVSQRMQEIGVRMALGAQSRDVLAMVLGEGFQLVILGLVLGIIGGVVLTHVLSSLLFGVNAASPATYFEVAGLMTGLAMIASYFPAARAARVNPMVALRYE